MIKETVKYLHFRVDPSILGLPRQMWLYEDKEEQADRFLNTLSSDALNKEQKLALLEGNAGLITEDEGETLTYVDKVDQKWKDEVSQHRKYLLEKKKREEEESRATLAERASVFKQGLQSLGENANEDDLMESLTKQANQEISKKLFIQKWLENDPEKKKACDDLLKTFSNKQFNFVFKGHEYRFKDSARDQGRCPHCEQKAKESMWNKDKDKDSFIGTYHFGEQFYAECFECPSCHEKFFYHKEARDVQQ